MADNWLQFSEVIPNVTSEEEAWIDDQLEAVAVVDGKEHPYELGEDEVEINGKSVAVEKTEFVGCRAYRDMEDYDRDMSYDSVGFEYDFCDDDAPPEGWGRHMWLYADDCADIDRVGHFVQKFLRKFRPKEYWSLTYATTCSKPRVGEFGGGAMFVTAAEIKYDNAYGFIEQQRAELAAK